MYYSSSFFSFFSSFLTYCCFIFSILSFLSLAFLIPSVIIYLYFFISKRVSMSNLKLKKRTRTYICWHFIFLFKQTTIFWDCIMLIGLAELLLLLIASFSSSLVTWFLLLSQPLHDLIGCLEFWGDAVFWTNLLVFICDYRHTFLHLLLVFLINPPTVLDFLDSAFEELNLLDVPF